MTHYFTQHPNIFVSEYKEPHFFCEYGGRDVSTTIDYLYLFSTCTTQHKWLLDASVLYMYFPEAIPNIIKFNPDARFLVMLRDPMTMVPSWFSQMQGSRHGREDAESLENAWALIEDRKAGRNIPAGCSDPRILYYDQIARYAEQLGRLFSIVPWERIHIVVFDDFKQDPRACFANACAFLQRTHPVMAALWRGRILCGM